MVRDEWFRRASAALDEARSAKTSVERNAVVAKHSKLWSELKEALGKLSDGKCWYCETKYVRSDFAVDHFRPKSGVIGCPSHPGYWWLAFDPTNYRFSCTYCNSARRDPESEAVNGKQHAFPIMDETLRVFGEDQFLEFEEPLFLDPTIAGDPHLLYFEGDGQVVPSRDEAQDSIAHRRATASIEAYHLNHSKLKRQRRRLHRRIRQIVNDGDIYFGHGPEDDRVSHARRAVVKEIKFLRSKAIKNSAAAGLYLDRLNNPTHRTWLGTILGAA
ncbi:MAG: hypothetical protein QOJ65_852 [Fimbriimonadaceae bacterium]|nr:hypothetical protein [Fimbriimonadaceae bacterium]